MTRELRITISGPLRSGRTTVGIAIRDFLREWGLDAELIDSDAPEVLTLKQEAMQDKRMHALFATKVSIDTQQTMREAKTPDKG
jgi:hypothetical protein